MSNLTYDNIMKTFREIQAACPRPREPSMLDFLRPRFGGMKVFEAPPPPPKLQVRDIKFSDGTSILPDDFRRHMNAWLVGRFGFDERGYLFHDKAIQIGHDMLVINPKHIAMLRDCWT